MTVSEFGLKRKEHGWRRLLGADLWFGGCALLLVLLGTLAIFSVSRSDDPGLFKRHLMLMAIGAVPFAVFFVTPPSLLRRLSAVFYILNLLMLGGALAKGQSEGGAQRWLNVGPIQFQPSEMTKILVVLTLATFFAVRQDQISKLSTFVLSFLHVLPSLLLVFMQPHLGATIAIVVAWLSISVVAYVPWKYILITIAGAVGLFIFAINTPGILREYHYRRMREMFIASNAQDRYQQFQAEVAIGTGGIEGKGFLKGDRKQSGSVPVQSTDFIVTVPAEENGFIGISLLMVAFGAFFFRGWQLALQMQDRYSRMVTIGCLSMLGFHLIVNLSMNTGLGPVVGLWLPFISYGGTALWLTLSCVGVILNLSIRAEEEQGMFGGGGPAKIVNSFFPQSGPT